MREATIFYVRKDEQAVYLKHLELFDLITVIGAMGIWVPLTVITEINFAFTACMTFVPAIAFILIFRKGRRKGFFMHWLSYKLRPKYWRFGTRHTESLVSLRSRMICTWRPTVTALNPNPTTWTGAISGDRWEGLSKRFNDPNNPFIQGIVKNREMRQRLELESKGSVQPSEAPLIGPN